MGRNRWPKRRDDLKQTLRDNGDGSMSVIWTRDPVVWLGWITMRDDSVIDEALNNPNRWTKLHAFPDQENRRAACGAMRPPDDSNLGVFGERSTEGRRTGKCTRCERRRS
jgi:hypothetical protein